MLKKISRAFIYLFFIYSINSGLSAQVLDVKETIQEQDQWCWAASSTAILNYYGKDLKQCQVAEFTREHADWNNYGSIDCCQDPTQGCNYWNFNWGAKGSIEDILTNWGISSYGKYKPLELDSIEYEIKAKRPFIIRWEWAGGGGHFIVGYGIEDSTIYYMNPWFGEGLKFADYSWMITDGSHTWTHTNVISTSPSSVQEEINFEQDIIDIYPNPTSSDFSINASKEIKGIKIFSYIGNLVKVINGNDSKIFVSDLPDGIFYLQIQLNQSVYNKLIVISR
jgi:hypothetical protein